MMFVSVEQAAKDLKNGKMIVMVDDTDRENEGDLVFAGEFSDVEKVNFAITHAKGVLCVALNKDIAKKLELNLMVDKNTSSHETAFTVTIDAKTAKTGVSAYERDMTIRLMNNPNSTPDDFVRPGHIFPLIAKDGGVLVRTGHTEGSVDLCKIAGITQSAVICEVVKSDGNMARRDDLEKFCKEFGLNMISVAQIVKYRLEHETLISLDGPKSVNIAGFKAKAYSIKDLNNHHHTAYVFGDLKERANVKFHKILSDEEFLISDKFAEFMSDLRFLNEHGGVLLMLNSHAKDESYEFKDYGIGAQILLGLGIKTIKILTTSEDKEYVGLSGFGIDIIK
ncbi:MAG: bifunctional 3,4-dihydroxy-2-butanone 4-phosphate synthase/GTP cyclohydrolase II [Campylobacter sp.]|nr:bifunctional 3,4-dihydroxy-2-butanone 4-phosphate synthase/GTP cyclohydrolase II [Campylobacter sp.]